MCPGEEEVQGAWKTPTRCPAVPPFVQDEPEAAPPRPLNDCNSPGTSRRSFIKNKQVQYRFRTCSAGPARVQTPPQSPRLPEA